MQAKERAECVVGWGVAIYASNFDRDFPSSFPREIHMLRRLKTYHACSNATDNNQKLMIEGPDHICSEGSMRSSSRAKGRRGPSDGIQISSQKRRQLLPPASQQML
ncbi:hypothetical protein V6N11_039103 [Hibiscus sabdariffa]|uniref:Uncharacterized protein n=1 Tax=Hibiscus sabdariffa TaxID=183260 RepID=A0ABR2SMM3_9ROSI